MVKKITLLCFFCFYILQVTATPFVKGEGTTKKKHPLEVVKTTSFIRATLAKSKFS